ncbi:type II secretion system protein N [Corticibacter populi]|uniref:Type II secretion system protein N n=2 Tax=Corticibacter populi TaxID=1550736 RepID=A0A3M6QKQ0_9BURK|nr:type II secretion system protein N [Corticibacter populi]RMX03079.1 type II secretion system protein N [Corticibacter populi]RZS33424.1 general secretion pathway protein N [Corticibacter populi]
MRQRVRPQRAAAAASRTPGLRRWAVLGALLGMLLALLLFAPARWLAAAVAAASGQQVLLQDARGTVWNGTAQLVLSGGTGSRDQMVLPGHLDWRIRPAWLGADVHLLPDCCASAPLAARLRLGWQRVAVTVEDHASQWPASLLQGLGAPWNTLQLDGTLTLQLRQFGWQSVQGRDLLRGTAELSLRNASSSLTTIRPMGSYRLIMRGAETVELTLSTDAGPLQLSGSGQWQGGRLRFAGEASAAPEHLPALSNLLSLLGRRDGPRAILNF